MKIHDENFIPALCAAIKEGGVLTYSQRNLVVGDRFEGGDNAPAVIKLEGTYLAFHDPVVMATLYIDEVSNLNINVYNRAVETMGRVQVQIEIERVTGQTMTVNKTAYEYTVFFLEKLAQVCTAEDAPLMHAQLTRLMHALKTIPAQPNA